MATAPLPLTPRFQQRLQEFKRDLSPDQEEHFKFTTLDDLKRLVHSIQEEQTKSRRLTNLRRLAPFLEAMEQFDKVVQVFLNAADLLACIWGPMKFLLLATQTYHDAFNALLDAYVDIGESIPLLAQYEQVFQDKSQMHVVLEFVYTDVLEFHSSAIKYFKSPVWKQLFHATWKTFRSKFEPTLSNLRRHKSLLETESNLFFLQQYQVDRQKTQMQFENIELQAEQNRKIAVNNWLSPAESESDYRAATSARLENPNSCRWILQEEKMKRWLDPKYPLQPLLWVNGKPGAGKTVLASLIIDECRRSSHGQTMFFFHKHGEEKKNTLIATLRGLLSQAVRIQPQLIPYLFEEAAKSGSGLLEDVELAKALTEISLAAFDSIFLVLDGLDECPISSKKPITTFFRSLIDMWHQQRPGAFRCCFFSQQDNDIGDLLKTVPSFTITGKQNSTDIRSFCHIKAETIREELGCQEEMAHRMADKVSSRADGMFVFAVLIMKYLEEQTSWKNLEKEVEDMPLDLNGVYERIVKRVLYDAALAERTAARMLLGWLLIAVRPLKWHEVQGAIAYDQPSHSFDLEGSKLRKGPKRLCGSLVELFDDGEIRLVHLSAKLYLERNVIDGPKEELKFLCHCLSYLQLPAFDQDLEEKDARRFVLSGHYAFMDYALPSWTFHLRNLLQHGQLEQNGVQQLAGSFRAFFKDRHTAAKYRTIEEKAVKRMISPFKNERFLGQLAESIRLAQNLSFDEVHNKALPNSSDYFVPQVILVRTIIEDFVSNSSRRTQLQEIHGSELFKCPKLRCRYFSQGFLDAQERDNHLNEHERPYRCSYSGCVVDLLGYPTEQHLQRHEAEVHHEGPGSFTFPRHGIPTSSETCEEIQNGNEEAFDSWIDQFEGEIPLDEICEKRLHKPAKLGGPLRAAVHAGNIDILNKILDRIGSVLVSSSKSRGEKGIAVDLVRDALRIRNLAVVEAILSRCEALEDSDILRLFFKAAHLGLDEMAIKLLDHERCEMAKPSRGPTYLAYAIRSGRMAVVRALILIKGIDPNLKTDGGTALHKAVVHDRPEVARFLLESTKCKKQSKDNYGRTAWQMAYHRGQLDFLEAIFLESTSEPDEDDEYWILATKLIRAARKGDLPTVQAILNQPGAPVNPAGFGPTPVHLAVAGKHTAVVDALLGTGVADVDRSAPYHGRLDLVTDRAISESVMQNDVALFCRLLVYSKDDKRMLQDYVRREGTAEILEAVDARIKAEELLELLPAHETSKADQISITNIIEPDNTTLEQPDVLRENSVGAAKGLQAYSQDPVLYHEATLVKQTGADEMDIGGKECSPMVEGNTDSVGDLFAELTNCD